MSFTGSVQSGDADPAFKVSIRLRTFPTTSVVDDSEDDTEVKIEDLSFMHWA